MKHLGFGLGLLFAGLVYYISTKDAPRRLAALPAPLPDSPANPMLRLYQRHPEYLKSLQAVKA